MARPSKYSADFRTRALRLIAEPRPVHDTEWAITSVAAKLGISTETLRKWLRQDRVDGRQRIGTMSARVGGAGHGCGGRTPTQAGERDPEGGERVFSPRSSTAPGGRVFDLFGGLLGQTNPPR